MYQNNYKYTYIKDSRLNKKIMIYIIIQKYKNYLILYC